MVRDATIHGGLSGRSTNDGTMTSNTIRRDVGFRAEAKLASTADMEALISGYATARCRQHPAGKGNCRCSPQAGLIEVFGRSSVLIRRRLFCYSSEYHG